MKHLVLISVVLLSFNAWTEEWSAYIDTPVNESRYIGRFETKEECQAMSACYIEKVNIGSLLDVIFANKIKEGSFRCLIVDNKETEKEVKEAKKWTGKFIFGLNEKSCNL